MGAHHGSIRVIRHTARPQLLGTLSLGRAATTSRVLALLILLYLFILSITLLSASFKLFGAEHTDRIFHATENPLTGLMIGILGTSIIQSSSTTTSLVVGLVASGLIGYGSAIPMIMGANIGTSITNTLVSLGHVSRREEFRRAFEASIVHDFFNLCAVAVLFPLQVRFNLIGASATYLERLAIGFEGMTFHSPLATITKPVAAWIIHATGESAWLSTTVACVLLFLALNNIVRVLKAMVLRKVERFFQRYIFRTGALGFLVGIGLTVMVQSSSITTSLVVPLVGAGVLTVRQVYPYLLGSNIGTTITAFLASFVTGSPQAVAVAFAHLLFNSFGILIFWPLKRIPLFLSSGLASWTVRSRLITVAYIVIVFFVVPSCIIFFTR
ncbi:MAG: hypothetical protein GF346_01860 [Candidatus Eisenbacteria bacterium]|nr:hypothetical protein [Candidatus Latescibacterota bacterium]MBD3301176.1 hypothetical protein [Candidatus Eisenbacteria bacterium]